MKSLLLVVLLAVAASAAIIGQEIVEDPEAVVGEEEVVYSDVAEVAALEADSGSVDVAHRGNLSLGTIGPDSTLLTLYQVSIANPEIPFPNRIFHFNYASNIRITAIRVTQIGSFLNSTTSIDAGGLNHNFVSIRIQTARGCLNHSFEIYGR